MTLSVAELVTDILLDYTLDMVNISSIERSIIMFKLNPDVIEMCGEGSTEMLNNLINAIGENAAINTNIDTMYGLTSIGGVTMPRCVTVATDIADRVAADIYDFYVRYRSNTMEEIEVRNEKFSKGDIPLMVSNAVGGILDAAKRMAGE